MDGRLQGLGGHGAGIDEMKGAGPVDAVFANGGVGCHGAAVEEEALAVEGQAAVLADPLLDGGDGVGEAEEQAKGLEGGGADENFEEWGGRWGCSGKFR